jgi:tRNA(fMet)-specific endonuclease VapC
MIFLLDTDMFIFMVRGLKPGRRPQQRKRAEEVLSRCRQAQVDGDLVGLSAVTVSELEFGARGSDDYEAEVQAVRKLMTPFQVYDYDSTTAPVHYGEIRHQLESKGLVIGAMDLLIAAHARAMDATLVTNNVAHFGRVSGLKTANWLRDA